MMNRNVSLAASVLHKHLHDHDLEVHGRPALGGDSPDWFVLQRIDSKKKNKLNGSSIKIKAALCLELINKGLLVSSTGSGSVAEGFYIPTDSGDECMKCSSRHFWSQALLVHRATRRRVAAEVQIQAF